MSSLKLLTHLHVACRLPHAAACPNLSAAGGKPLVASLMRRGIRHWTQLKIHQNVAHYFSNRCVSVCASVCSDVCACVCLCVCAWVCVSIMTNLCVTLARLFTIRVVPFSALTHFAEEHSAMLSSPSLPRSLAPCLCLSLELGIEQGYTVYIDKASRF